MKRIIVESGVSNYHIVTSQFTEESELFAAYKLKEYLYKATNTIVPYFSDRCEKRTHEIRIGRDVRGNKNNLNGIKNEGFRIVTDNNDIAIYGKTGRGTIYGVFYFLEKFLNYRCFTPVIESYKTLDTLIINDIDIIKNPSFEYRDVYFRSAFDTKFAVDNRLNGSMGMIPNEMGGKTKFFNFHHSFYDILPPDIYFDKHPEYYSEVNGVRLREDAQLCLTNEDVIKESIKRVKEWIKARPDCKIFSVAQNDKLNFCTCEKCKQMDEHEGSHSGTIIYFVNRIAEEIEKDYPDVMIHTFAYQYSRVAPKYIKPRKNVIVRLCNFECRWDIPMRKQLIDNPKSHSAEFVNNITDWSKICNHLYIWDYACNFAYYLLPFPNYYTVADNMRLYKSKGVAGVLQQGNFSYGNSSGLADLEVYIVSRLLWDTESDVDELINEFTDCCYGNSSEYIREYIQLLCKSTYNKNITLYYKTYNEYLTEDFISKAENLFKKALETENPENIHNMIEKEYISILFMRITHMELEDKLRFEYIEKLDKLIKKHKISEIQERVRYELSVENMKEHNFHKPLQGKYPLYYIMK